MTVNASSWLALLRSSLPDCLPGLLGLGCQTSPKSICNPSSSSLRSLSMLRVCQRRYLPRSFQCPALMERCIRHASAFCVARMTNYNTEINNTVIIAICTILAISVSKKRPQNFHQTEIRVQNISESYKSSRSNGDILLVNFVLLQQSAN